MDETADSVPRWFPPSKLRYAIGSIWLWGASPGGVVPKSKRSRFCINMEELWIAKRSLAEGGGRA